MIISFDRKYRGEDLSSRNVYQILDKIEEEMNRLYQEIECNHAEMKKRNVLRKKIRKLKIRNFRDSNREKEIQEECHSMDGIAADVAKLANAFLSRKL